MNGYNQGFLPGRGLSKGREQTGFVRLSRHARAQDGSGLIDRYGKVPNATWPDAIGGNPITPRQYDGVLLGSREVNVWGQPFVGIWNEGIHIFESE